MKHSSAYFSWLLLFCVVAAMSSCRSYSYTSRMQKVNDGWIGETKKTADLETDLTRKITTVGEWSRSAKAARLSAEYKAIQDNKIDVIVDPIYKVTMSPVFNGDEGAPWYTVSYRAEVTGYAGTYKKILSQQDQINQLEDVKREDIEKLKLLTEPNFYRYYYNHGSVNGSVLIGSGLPANNSTAVVESAPAGLPILRDVVSPMDIELLQNKYNKMVKAGKIMVGVGGTMFGIGMICAIAGGVTGSSALPAGAAMIGLGAGFAVAVGTPCWVVGEKKLKALDGATLALDYNMSPAGLNFAFKF